MALPSRAESGWPKQMVRIVVPLAAGGAADALARPLAEGLAKRLGQTVIVDNKPGVGGNLGTDFVAKSPADGYTLLLTPPAPIAQAVALYKKLPYDPRQDLVQISDIAQARVACAVNAALPAKSFGEFLAYAKAHPDKLAVGSWGAGSQPHIIQSFMDLNFGTQTLHVPYKGEAPLLTDLLGGQIGMTCASVSSLKPHLASGKLRALATVGPTRATALPEVPTFAEAGYKQDVFQLTGPYTLLAPAKTPQEIVDKIGQEVRALLRSPEILRQLDNLGVEPIGNTPAEAAAAYRARLPVVVKAIRDTGATLD
jgi:tripartite-type tricarboxylate transporter receptor subunit TctC